MKGFQENSHRIKNDVFMLYMPDHKLVIAFNLQKNPNCFYFWNGIFKESP